MNRSTSPRLLTVCGRYMSFILLLIIAAATASAENKVTYKVVDNSGNDNTESLSLNIVGISNDNDRTQIVFNLTSTNTPFTVYKVERVVGDSIYTPVEPFTLEAGADEVDGKKAKWRISLDFPFSTRFGPDDVLILHTDRGILRSPISAERRLMDTIEIMREDFAKKIDSSTRDSRRAWIILGIVLAALAVIASIIYVAVRRRFIQKRREIEELSMLIADRTDRNHELESKIDALYGSRLDTLNMLCNEYFEKNDSEKVRLTLYNEVEKHILALRDTKSIAELEKIVNTFLDNILVRVQEQLPDLNRKDILFLTYLYAGFSPRAVCIFTDLKIKNFYNRRSRLKERILASEAPDREFFASKM